MPLDQHEIIALFEDMGFKCRVLGRGSDIQRIEVRKADESKGIVLSISGYRCDENCSAHIEVEAR